jgi:hypothetical protein
MLMPNTEEEALVAALEHFLDLIVHTRVYVVAPAAAEEQVILIEYCSPIGLPQLELSTAAL